ncbi:MAG: hypothetical protein AAF702_33125 [Chloroflexota bacterium]
MGLLAQIVYRGKQFVTGFAATISKADLVTVQGILSSDQYALFQQMPIDAQRHSLNVLMALQRAGYSDPDLASAALLHDVGKVAANNAGVPITLWIRGPLVILEILSPLLLQRLASHDIQQGWRYALYVQQNHPEIGERWAAEAGSSEVSCWLIAHHQDKQRTLAEEPVGHHKRRQLLAALQWADSRN